MHPNSLNSVTVY